MQLKKICYAVGKRRRSRGSSGKEESSDEAGPSVRGPLFARDQKLKMLCATADYCSNKNKHSTNCQSADLIRFLVEKKIETQSNHFNCLEILDFKFMMELYDRTHSKPKTTGHKESRNDRVRASVRATQRDYNEQQKVLYFTVMDLLNNHLDQLLVITFFTTYFPFNYLFTDFFIISPCIKCI